MKERQSFPECDGHMESILIGCGVVKVSFQTWDCKKLVLIYRDVESVAEKNSVFGDISLYEEKRLDGGLTEYSFWDAEDTLVLRLRAGSLNIFVVGDNADINAALFDVGYEYIGNQNWRDTEKRQDRKW